jgi:hypothetical protein
MCLDGLRWGSLSRVPRRSRSVSGASAFRFRIGEPHRPQKHRRFPGEDSHSLSSADPAINRNAAAGMEALLANAAPDAFRHWLQWQFVIGPISASISY